MLESGQILQGRYHIIRPLGHGGMGTVYEARDTKLFGKHVALKEILLDKTLIPNQKDHRIVQRAFEREAKILTQLEHEAFPQVIDYFVENECQFLVMELIHGKDLSELLKKRKTPFEVEEVLQWGIQLLDALDYLHTLEPPTIHRDIKPQNLKLNSRKRIKLLDFGIAKGAEFPSNITFSNQTFVAATFNYSPFEQVFRVLDSSFKEALKPFYGKQLNEIENQSADCRSDIYSLGATFYHLLTKHLPFDSLKRTLELWVGNDDPLPSPQSLNPKIPIEISDWIVKAMAVEKEKRFESASDMKDALQVIVEGDKLREESSRKLKWQKEQELLRIERQRLAEERRRFEEERQQFIDITQEPFSDALTIRDVSDGNPKNLKTNTGIQPDIFNQPSVITVVAEKQLKEITSVESPTDFTATSYLVDFGLGAGKGKTEVAEKTELAKSEEMPKTTIPLSMQRKQQQNFPATLILLFLLGGTILGGLVLQNVFSRNEASKQENQSAVSNQNSSIISNQNTSVLPESTPEIKTEATPEPTPTAMPEISSQPLESNTNTKPFPNETKVKQNAQVTRPSVALPTQPPRLARPTTPKTNQTPKSKNPDCIFNNDCR